MKPIYLLLATICLALFSGCGLKSERLAGEKAAEAYLQARIKSGGLGGDELYSDIFFSASSPGEWAAYKQSISNALGNLKSYSLAGSNVSKKWNHKVGDQHVSGTFVVLNFLTEYEHGKGQEQIVMLKQSGTDKFLVLSFNVDSARFTELIDKAAQQQNDPKQ